jgi:hypothetical protein
MKEKLYIFVSKCLVEILPRSVYYALLILIKCVGFIVLQFFVLWLEPYIPNVGQIFELLLIIRLENMGSIFYFKSLICFIYFDYLT